MIEIEKDFRVPADAGTVYDFLLKLEDVGGCIPGGHVGPAGDDGSHPASIAVRLGPMRFNYRGAVRLEDRDEAARRATLAANVREARGQGSAKARMQMSVEAQDDAARVVTRTELQLTGRAASMGRGVIDDVAARMVRDMAACVTERLSAQPRAGAERPAVRPEGAPAPAPPRGSSAPRPAPQEPIGGLRLIARVVWDRLVRLLSGSKTRR